MVGGRVRHLVPWLLLLLTGCASWLGIEEPSESSDAGVNGPDADTGPSWQPRKKLVPGRGRMGAAVAGGKVYVFGGTASTGQNYLQLVEVYDPGTDSWSRLADMPTGRAFGGNGALVAGEIWLVGDSGASGVCTTAAEAYGVAGDSWTPGADLPGGRCGLVVGSVAGQVIAAGGGTDAVSLYTPGGAWTPGPPLPDRRDYAASATLGDRFYVIGGSDGIGIDTATVFAFDAGTMQWETLERLPSPRSNFAAAAWGDRIYVAGGLSGGQAVADVDVYDPATDTWTSGVPLSTPRSSLNLVAVDGVLYAIGGNHGGIVDTVEALALTP
jgi:N-acetylneuraminic acid mutarotase